MRNGYKLIWSINAAQELEMIIDYLQTEWSTREINNFIQKLDKRLNIITQSPFAFPKSDSKTTIRRSVLNKHNVIYYQVIEDEITIISIFNPKQNPYRLKL